MDRTSVKASDLEKDTVVFLSSDYENELNKENKFVIEYIKDFRQNKKKEVMLSLFEELSDNFIENNKEKICPVFGNKSPYLVKAELFKKPQNIVRVTSIHEVLFVIGLINNAHYLNSWIKSRDIGFYPIEFEYFKKGKDRMRASFNPDLFIKIKLSDYIRILRQNGVNIDLLTEMEDKGVNTVIKSVEIFSDENTKDTFLGKKRDATMHFETVNKKLIEGQLPADYVSQTSAESQYYAFDLTA